MTAAILAVALFQMDKRDDFRYDPEEFAQLKPAVGDPAPDLCLADLDGRPWSLHELVGRTILLVKGSYT